MWFRLRGKWIWMVLPRKFVWWGPVVVIVPFWDLWKEMGWLQFSDPYRTASSTTGGWSRWNILMCFIYIYNSEHYGLSFLDLMDAFFYKDIGSNMESDTEVNVSVFFLQYKLQNKCESKKFLLLINFHFD